MKPRNVVLAALAASSLIALASEPANKLSPAWILAGQKPGDYTIGLDMTETTSHAGSKFISYSSGTGHSWGTLMQTISAEAYRGQRVRFKARVKARDVSDWAGLWMRVDGEDGMLSLYNSHDKPIKGSTDWQWRSVVLDVPSNAKAIAFGVIDGGKGTVWLDEITLQAVGKDTPVDTVPPLPKAPAL